MPVAIICALRIAQALGFPVVPEVYIRHARSFGERLTVGRAVGVVGRSEDVTKVIPGFCGAGVFGKATKFSEKCSTDVGKASDSSGVERTILEFDTLKQCFKGSSVLLL